MSTSRSILFFAEEKSEMVEFIQKAMKEIHKELYPKFKPHIVKREKGMCAIEMYASMFVLPDGEDLTYVGGEEIFLNRFKKYNSKYKLYAYMGGSNTTYRDKNSKEESYYPLFYYRMLVKKIKKSGLKNDVLLTCVTSTGGWEHRSYPPKIRSIWTGDFL